MKLRFALVLSAVLLATGCGASAFDIARSTVATGARVVAATDATLAHGYTDASLRAYAHASTAAEYRDQMEEWDAVETVQHQAVAVLFTAESSIDAAEEAHDKAGLVPILGCVAEAARRLVDAMREVGLADPSLASYVALVAQYTTCREERAR